MIDKALDKASRKASHAAGSAAIGLGAGVALAVGVAFWTLAAWLFMTEVTTAMNAAAIIGAVYVGLGCLGFAVVSIRGKKQKTYHPPAAEHAPQQQQANVDNLMGAFVTGMNAGIRARSGPR